MHFNRKNINFLVLILLVINGFSQEKKQSDLVPVIPNSIYTMLSNTSKLSELYIANKKLNKTSFKFVLLNVEDVKNGFTTISSGNLYRKPTKYIYETYQQIYRDKGLTSTFFTGHDLRKHPISPK